MSAARVAQWATGSTGRLALQAVINAPELELVGVRVYDPVKVGRDAGQLVDGRRTGVFATDSNYEIVRSRPDVVLYMAGVEKHAEMCFTDVANLLASGIDVIATGSSFVDVRAFDPAHARLIDLACKEGEATFLGVGLFPGFWGECVAPLLSRLAYRCDNIVVRESLSYAGYPSSDLLFSVMGYGHPTDSDVPVLSDPARAASAFTGTARIIAKALNLDIASMEPFREVAVTDSELRIAAGVVPAGTVGAMKLGVRADCGSVEIVVEHVTWMGADVAPEWSRSPGYEIEFDGKPTMRCNLVLGTDGEEPTEMGCMATAMHAVHAIPIVRQARPGIMDLADTPPFVGSPNAFEQ